MTTEASSRVYLAGPMRARPFYNAPAFDKAAATLRSRGYEVLNPVDFDRESYQVDFTLYPLGTEEIPGLPPLPDLLLRDLEYVSLCSAIVLLPGYENSKGARTEKAFAEFCGLRVLYYTPEEGSLWSIPDTEAMSND